MITLEPISMTRGGSIMRFILQSVLVTLLLGLLKPHSLGIGRVVPLRKIDEGIRDWMDRYCGYISRTHIYRTFIELSVYSVIDLSLLSSIVC
jgi:hypothetical protein